MKTVFISMIGLEERVLGVFREGKLLADEYLLFINKDYENDQRVETYQKEIIGKHLSGKNYKLLHSSYRDPFAIIREFNKLRTEEGPDFQGGKVRVMLDISTFNRQNLLIMLLLLRKVLGVHDVEIIYTIPQEVNEDISKGAGGFSNVPFFAGAFSIEKRKLLILLTGYEIDRPLLLWRELQPSKVILVEGVEPTAASFYKANREAVKELSKFAPAVVKQISANDPNKARVQLSEIIRQEQDSYNIFASPLNTKLQAVGLYLAWEENPNFQIVIAFPDRFSTWLTKGIKEVKRYTI